METKRRYTATEIVTELKLDPKEVIGKMRLRVAGVSMNAPEHQILIQPGTTKVEVIVGNEAYELEVTEGVDPEETPVVE